jgi:hypothetical protein
MSATNDAYGANYESPNQNSSLSFNDLFHGRDDTAMSPNGWNSDSPKNVGFLQDTAMSATNSPNGRNSETPNVLPRQDSATSVPAAQFGNKQFVVVKADGTQTWEF